MTSKIFPIQNHISGLLNFHRGGGESTSTHTTHRIDVTSLKSKHQMSLRAKVQPYILSRWGGGGPKYVLPKMTSKIFPIQTLTFPGGVQKLFEPKNEKVLELGENGKKSYFPIWGGGVPPPPSTTAW